jgi:cytidylate kinase
VRTSVICVSHTAGAGGPEIGRLLAERLGFRYADEAIVVDAARAEHLFPEAVAQAEARSPGRWLEVDFNRFELTETVRELIRAAIVQTADEGDVVIVAHAASFALADRDGVLRVLVTAADDSRARRLGQEDGLDEKGAAKRRVESDRNRALYLKRFYGISHELPTHFDLVLNTDRLTAEQAAETIVHALTR